MQNFHTHTYRCHHAKGTDRDYVEAAIKAGYTEIGFSDHVPYLFPTDYYSDFRMNPEETEEYVSSIRALQEEYKDKITIRLGFEVEYYPQLFDKLLHFLKQYHYDYLILGQHFTENEYDKNAFYSGHKTKSIEIFDTYIHQTLEALKTGEFLYFAHPDLINYTGDKKIYEEKMRYFVKELKKLNIPIECNFLGFWDKRHYPNKTFWKLVAEEQNPVVIGLDAHQPEVYLDKKRLDEMKKFLSDLGIEPIEKLDITK
ncbi:MAG: histidinol-phosphatase [Eubacterium sp.]|nr:histidinol-phosphatase [Eubacterium sp.]